jgi:hypothetical protein
VDLLEQMVMASGIGRLSLAESAAFLEQQLCGSTAPALKALWEGGAPADEGHAVALLEEARLIVLCAGHLLCDEAGGETPVIPDAVMSAAKEQPALLGSIQNIANGLIGLAELQASRIPSGQGYLSPLLAHQFLWFFTTFSTVYVLPDLSLYDSALLNTSGFSSSLFGTSAAAASFIEFSVTLTSHYSCLWQQEKQVSGRPEPKALGRAEQNKKLVLGAPKASPRREPFTNILSRSLHSTQVLDSATSLLLSLAKSKKLRRMLPQSAAWGRLGWVVGGGMSLSNKPGGAQPPDAMVAGFQRIGYTERASILSVLVCGCGGLSDPTSQSLLNGLLSVLEQLLTNLQPTDEDGAELLVELMGGVGRAPFVDAGGEGSESEVSARAKRARERSERKDVLPALPCRASEARAKMCPVARAERAQRCVSGTALSRSLRSRKDVLPALPCPLLSWPHPLRSLRSGENPWW